MITRTLGAIYNIQNVNIKRYVLICNEISELFMDLVCPKRLVAGRGFYCV